MLLGLGLLTATMLGLSLTSIFFQESPRHQLLLKASLSTGVGLSATGCCYFYSLVVFPGGRYAFIPLEVALLIGLGWISVQYKVATRTADALAEGKTYWPLAIMLFSTIVAASTIWSLFVQAPPGQWDAIAIWNLKARHLFAGDVVWKTNLFSEYLAHPDYPLAIPSTVASLWQLMGKDSAIVPILVACAFAFATVGLLFSAIGSLVNKSHATLAALTLLSTPFFLLHTVSQYADVPLAFLFLSVVVLFSLHDISSARKYDLIVFAGMIAGFAAWTKNEGILFLVVIVTARLLIRFMKRDYDGALKDFLYCGIGAAPPLLLLSYFKIVLSPANDLASRWHFMEAVQCLWNLHRHAIVLRAFAHEALHFGSWFVHPLPFQFLYLALSMMRGGIFWRRADISTAGLTLLLMLGGYYAIYVTQPFDVEYLLNSSLKRLLLQLWPMFLFYVFLRSAPDSKTQTR